ncbi:TcmI family type II polyketide cyclase [Amycolatopsis granulosa]|uniref:TcmI family type II polyketide cyclase n=1 Tax=Amycolatopsis granulosa TaxID=185684 RepID=UPI0014232FF6|nr:TcmI family type II polyketide cyclase [Amycolatopsis granulosa]NIH88279.1 quinol monooxygenase YgiN [Amycolatopsis granulosa]
MTYRSVIVARIRPDSEEKVADIFARNDETTRPQDFGVIGRTLYSLKDLYIHVIERNVDPKVSLSKARGLPTFQQICEDIDPYVTPYSENWKVPADAVAKEFYHWTPNGNESRPANYQAVIVARIKPGTEPEVARIFAESDAGPLPVKMGITARYLYSLEDVYLHVIERADAPVATAMQENHGRPAFAKIMEDLSSYISPYDPDNWRTPADAVAKEFYRWRADD